jgi:hypothetical protein
LTSTTLAGLAVVPALNLDCGGKTSSIEATVGMAFVDAGKRDASAFGVSATVAAAFDGGGFVVAASFDGGFGVGATFDGGFGVAATFDAAADALEFTVAAVLDSGNEPDASGFTVAANIKGGDESGHG